MVWRSCLVNSGQLLSCVSSHSYAAPDYSLVGWCEKQERLCVWALLRSSSVIPVCSALLSAPIQNTALHYYEENFSIPNEHQRGAWGRLTWLWEWGWILFHLVTAQLPAPNVLCWILLANDGRTRKKAQLGLPFPGWVGSPESISLNFWLSMFDMGGIKRKSACIPTALS